MQLISHASEQILNRQGNLFLGGSDMWPGILLSALCCPPSTLLPGKGMRLQAERGMFWMLIKVILLELLILLSIVLDTLQKGKSRCLQCGVRSWHRAPWTISYHGLVLSVCRAVCTVQVWTDTRIAGPTGLGTVGDVGLGAVLSKGVSPVLNIQLAANTPSAQVIFFVVRCSEGW